MYFRIDVPKNFAMSTGKHLAWSLFSINMQAWRYATSKKRHQHMCFPVKFANFLWTTFFGEHIWWLLLELSHELSLYCIWQQWMASFCGTYWLLLRVFHFFLFFSFFLFVCVFYYFLVFKLSLSILKIKQYSCS